MTRENTKSKRPRPKPVDLPSPSTPATALPADVNGHVSAAANGQQHELGLESIRERLLSELKPSPENDLLYRPVDPKDPDIIAMASSISKIGLRDPIVHTIDDYILSGHRRHVAAGLAGLETVPCRVEPFRREDEPDRFLLLLREYNRQRDKSFAEKLREELVTISPHSAHASLIAHRKEAATVTVKSITITGTTTRAAISKAKKPFLDAILGVLEDRRKFWPLSDRQIHYALLNNPPLKHASKPGSTYDNTPQSYKALTELLTRARLVYEIPMEAIADETRPVTIWPIYPGVRPFIKEQMDGFLMEYRRNLLQSQPNHIELLAEKNTLASILEPVADENCIPLTIGRGYSSLPPRCEMANRFFESGKENLVLLIVSDFDPDGEEIAHSFARSMRDDFDVSNIHPIKVALTAEQVKKYRLPRSMVAKKSSPNHQKFVDRFGNDVFEVEALRPEQLQKIVRAAIDEVVDTDLFNAEVEAEEHDAANLEGLRRTVTAALKNVDLGT